MRMLGIDPGNTTLGLVVLSKVRGSSHHVLHEQSVSFPKLKGHERQSAIAGEMIDVLNTYKPDMVVIEGYVVNRMTPNATIPLVELGSLLRYFLVQYGYRYLTVPPKQLKKYATGAGTGDKKKIIKAVQARWDHKAKNHDCADAFVLAHMGLAQGGAVHPLSLDERDILGSLKLTVPSCN